MEVAYAFSNTFQVNVFQVV